MDGPVNESHECHSKAMLMHTSKGLTARMADISKQLSADKVEVLRRLEEYELSSSLSNKLRQEFPFTIMSDQEINEYFIEFKKFVALLIINRGSKRRVAMTNPIVDEIWHTLIQSTQEYHEFCNILVGEYIHHKPSTKQEPLGRDTVVNFYEDYRKYFGEPPPIWKYRVDQLTLEGNGDDPMKMIEPKPNPLNLKYNTDSPTWSILSNDNGNDLWAVTRYRFKNIAPESHDGRSCASCGGGCGGSCGSSCSDDGGDAGCGGDGGCGGCGCG